MKPIIDKADEHKKWIQIFPDANSEFDLYTARKARSLILDMARYRERPTRQDVAYQLGISRFRLARLLKALDIEKEFFKIQKSKKRT